MEDFEILGLLFFFVLFLYFLIFEKKENENYQKKQYFFSYSEFIFFNNLKKILKENFGEKYDIFPKVRLADIFETKEQRNLNKIRAKHIDYLIVDNENQCNPILAIELNGSSHYLRKMQKSDDFKKSIFKESKLPLIYFWNNEIKKEEYIKEKIGIYLKKDL